MVSSGNLEMVFCEACNTLWKEGNLAMILVNYFLLSKEKYRI
ncbi:hypothetical protein ACNQGI_05120 [Flavobacterium sp. LS2R12]